MGQLVVDLGATLSAHLKLVQVAPGSLAVFMSKEDALDRSRNGLGVMLTRSIVDWLAQAATPGAS